MATSKTGQLYRLRIPIAITFIVGIMMILSQVIAKKQVPVFIDMAGRIQSWVMVISAFMAVATIFRVFVTWLSTMRERKTGSNWQLFLISAIGFLARFIVGIWNGLTGVWTNWILSYVLVPMETGIWAFNGFFYWSTAWRSFKIRSPEVGWLFFCMAVQTLSIAPVGSLAFPWITDFSNWLNNGIIRGGERAMLITTAITGVVVGIRTVLGMERGYLGGITMRPATKGTEEKAG